LILCLQSRWDPDLAASVLVDDAEAGILAAQRAGRRPLLVLTGRGAEQLAALRASGRDVNSGWRSWIPAAVGRRSGLLCCWRSRWADGRILVRLLAYRE
jgi:beta-phosphoglucomutase-like phosphatase (HAD superfamily)